MKKDVYETRGRPRKSMYEDICDRIRHAVTKAKFSKQPKGHVITVETGPLVGQIHCSRSYIELKKELTGSGLKVTAYCKDSKQVFRVRKVSSVIARGPNEAS